MRRLSYSQLLLLIWLVAWLSGSQAATTSDFPQWLQGVREDALDAGIQQGTIEQALAEPKLLDWVIKADRNQPEFKKTLAEYLRGALNQQRIDRGRQQLSEHREMLERVAEKYKVQPRFIVALWGIESYYGKHTGKVPIIDALVTLAYDGRRSDYFRGELINALKIVDAGHISHRQMLGSWAGAMGQLQFMPSSFLRYAVDGNGDGRIDLWNTPEDYLSSAANYLARMGWQYRQTWGREVQLPDGFDSALIGLENSLWLSDWQTLGVRRLNGDDLPKVTIQGALIQPEEAGGRTFLVYTNYQALLKWNRAHSFAIAVGMLADRIGS